MRQAEKVYNYQNLIKNLPLKGGALGGAPAGAAPKGRLLFLSAQGGGCGPSWRGWPVS